MTPPEMTPDDWRKNVRFVLIEPAEPGNVGASARAIKNMGFEDLALVNPRAEIGREALWFAHNAEDVLQGAGRYASIEEAVEGRTLVVGATRRSGKHRGAVVPLRDGAGRIRAATYNNKAAILFGREERGLYNRETDLCDYLVTVPSSAAQPSLNLSHAVMVVAYELHVSSDALGPSPRLADRADFDALISRAQEVIDRLGYEVRGDRQVGRNYLGAIRRIAGRADLTPRECKLLHGLLVRLLASMKQS